MRLPFLLAYELLKGKKNIFKYLLLKFHFLILSFTLIGKTKENHNYTEPILIFTTRWNHQYSDHKERQQQQKLLKVQTEN